MIMSTVVHDSFIFLFTPYILIVVTGQCGENENPDGYRVHPFVFYHEDP